MCVKCSQRMMCKVLSHVGGRLTSIQVWEEEQGRRPFKEPWAYEEQAVNEKIQTDLRRAWPANQPLLLQTCCVFVCRFPLSESIYWTKDFWERGLHDQNSCIHVGLGKHSECKCHGNMLPMCWCLSKNLSQRTLGLLDKRPTSPRQQSPAPTRRAQTSSSEMALRGSLTFRNNSSRIAWINYITGSLVIAITMYGIWKSCT